MSIIMNKTDITEIIYNGVNCEKVIFNGTTVFLKGFDVQEQSIELELPCLVWDKIPSSGSITYGYSGLTVHGIYKKNNLFIILYYYTYSEGLITYNFWHVGFSSDLSNWNFYSIFQNTISGAGNDITDGTLLYNNGVYAFISVGLGTVKYSDYDWNIITIRYSQDLINWNKISPDWTDSSDPLNISNGKSYEISLSDATECDDGFLIVHRIRDSSWIDYFPSETIDDKTNYYMKNSWCNNNNQSSYSFTMYDFIYDKKSKYITSGYFQDYRRESYGNIYTTITNILSEKSATNNTNRYVSYPLKGNLYDGEYYYRIFGNRIQKITEINTSPDSDSIIIDYENVPNDFVLLYTFYSKGYMLFIGTKYCLYKKEGSAKSWEILNYSKEYVNRGDELFLGKISKSSNSFSYGENQRGIIDYLIIEK